MGCRECCVRKLGLSHENPSLFVRAQWFKPLVNLIWSGVWALFFFSMLVLDIYYNSTLGANYLTYLTTLTYMLQTSTLLLDFVNALYVYLKRPDIRDGKATEMVWYLKVQWILFNVTNTCSVAVSVCYYALLSSVSFSHGSINTHLINSVHSILNILFTAKPVQILHFYQPVIYGALYITFTVIYHATGADPIYAPLDWDDDPVKAVLLATALLIVVLPSVHIFIFFSLFAARTYVAGKCFRSRVGPGP